MQKNVDPNLNLKEMRQHMLDITRMGSMCKTGKVNYYRAMVVVGNGKGVYGFGIGFGNTPKEARLGLGRRRPIRRLLELACSTIVAEQGLREFSEGRPTSAQIGPSPVEHAQTWPNPGRSMVPSAWRAETKIAAASPGRLGPESPEFQMLWTLSEKNSSVRSGAALHGVRRSLPPRHDSGARE